MRLAFGLALCLVFYCVHVNAKNVYGYVEKATIPEKSLILKAKLDTGAKTASLHAKHIHYVDVQGKPFVSFIVPTKSGDISFLLPHVGEACIKARSGEIAGTRIKNPFIKRPVVEVPIQLGDQVRVVRVNLANRKRFTYPLLLGRETLVAFDGLVDPAKKYTLS